MSDFEVVPLGLCASVAAERAAAVKHARGKIASIKRAKANGRLEPDLADHMVRCFDEFAEDLGRGLHLPGDA